MFPETTKQDEFTEIGTSGIEGFGGYFTNAYIAPLQYPTVVPTYQRLWRSDPEMTVVRNFFSALSGDMELHWMLPQEVGGEEMGEPTDDDKRYLDFAQSLGNDIKGGFEQWLVSCTTKTPFFGFGLWELPLGLRSEGWESPNGEEWKSKYNDGLIGLRGINWRDYSSFESWEMDETDTRVVGWNQNAPQVQPVTIPMSNLLHMTYGDPDNVEGLPMLESVYRIEKLLYNYQLVHGIGSERSAGHVKFSVDGKPDADDLAIIRKSARAIMSAQQGSYLTETDKVKAGVMDVPFSAADAIENMIRYLSITKYTLFGMQWVSLSSVSGVGSNAAMADSSDMSLLIFNSMVNSFVEQANGQLANRVLLHPQNVAAFPNATRVPCLKIKPADKTPELPELANFLNVVKDVIQLGDDDAIAIRKATRILPETLPEGETGEALPAQDDPSEPQGELAEMATGERFSIVDDALETKEADRLESLFVLAFLAQYEGVNVARIWRQSNGDMAEFERILTDELPPLADSLEYDEAKLLMTSLIDLGLGEGVDNQINRSLTSQEGVQVKTSGQGYASDRLNSLLGVNPPGVSFSNRIDNPFLEDGLDVATVFIISQTVSRIVRQLESEGARVTAKAIETRYRAEIEQLAKERGKLVASDNTGTLVNAGIYFAVDITQPRTKTWLRTRSANPRDIHLSQVGETVPYNSRFSSGEFWAGELINCKCGVLVGY